MKPFIFFISALILLSSCQDEIDVDLNSASPQLVVEAVVTNEPVAHYVALTRTVNFSDANDFPPVSNALVIITDNAGLNDTLVETLPGLYLTDVWAGQPGNTYNLTIVADGKTYTSTSKMPDLVPLDSIGFIENEFNFGGGPPAFFAVPKYIDPSVAGNWYRFKVVVNSDSSDAIVLFDDNVNNGVINSRPIVSFGETKIENGDTAKIEMQCIDFANYTYLSALAALADQGPGGGITPANPPTNISGENVLGYFSAHTTQKMMRVAP